MAQKYYKPSFFKKKKLVSIDSDKFEVKTEKDLKEIPYDEFNINWTSYFLSGDDNFYRKHLLKETIKTVFIYNGEIDGKLLKLISPVINMDMNNLRIKLYLAKQIDVYFDKENDKNYQFDLSFLNEMG